MKHVSANPAGRRRILETAQIIVGGTDFRAVGLSEIRQAPGVPKGAVNHHAGSRKAFGEAVPAATRRLQGRQDCPSR